MKKNRLLAGILSVSVALASMTSLVFATTFNDVEGDPTVSWAKESINKMTQAGYIKGYEDGTFKPYRAISKMECLLLMSRMLGVEEADYSNTVKAAKAEYSTTVSKYNTTYVDELCYLLYLGILSETDVVNYASAANANTELLRHQAAVLMSKMLGRDTEAKNCDISNSAYGDADMIPAVSKAYVEFVTQEGIMNGMDKDANGKTQFSPTTSLTRAQMATLLERTLKRLDKFTYKAIIDSIDIKNNMIAMDNGDVSEREINNDTIARQEGKEIKIDALDKGTAVSAIEIDGHIQLIEVTEGGTTDKPSNSGTIVYAKVSQTSESASGKKITLTDTEDSSNVASYTTAKDCVYTIKGAKAGFGDIKKGEFVKVTIEDGIITAIEVTEKEIRISGTLEALDFDEENHVYLTVEDTDGDVQEYVVSNKGATVKRDGETAEYRELATGDKVEMTLTYGKVTNVKATSSLEKFSGVLNEIIIAKKPSVTILVAGEEENYTFRPDAKIKVMGVDATIYDLRPGITVNGTLDGNEIKSLSASNVVTNEKGEFTAEVVSVNTSYKVINVIDAEGKEQSVYYSTKTNFLKSSGTSVSARDIVKGATLSITGSENNGVFEATIVIIK